MVLVEVFYVFYDLDNKVNFVLDGALSLVADKITA